MATRGQRKVCEMWNCEQPIRSRYFLCGDHYDEYRDGLLDKCPGCDRFKDVQYERCIECNNLDQRSKAGPYRREHSKAWELGDAEATEFFVYLLKLKDGTFYAGQTRELRERLMEHRDGQTKSTAGKDPKLVWFEVVDTREDAEEMEAELKHLRDKNLREIRRMVLDFQDLVKELDFS